MHLSSEKNPQKVQFGENALKYYRFSSFNNATAGGIMEFKCFLD
jgi:hypothetical protein